MGRAPARSYIQWIWDVAFHACVPSALKDFAKDPIPIIPEEMLWQEGSSACLRAPMRGGQSSLGVLNMPRASDAQLWAQKAPFGLKKPLFHAASGTFRPCPLTRISVCFPELSELHLSCQNDSFLLESCSLAP